MRSLLLAALLAVGACTAPTLPLPPPTQPDVSAAAEAGKVHLSSKGGVQPNAIVVVFNRNPDVARDRRVGGAQADAEGSWEADVWASPGDYLVQLAGPLQRGGWTWAGMLSYWRVTVR